MEDLETLKAQIQAELKGGIASIGAICRDHRVPPAHRVKAFEALADRGGLPAVRGNLVQVQSISGSLSDLREKRASLETQQAEVVKEIADLRKYLEPPNVLPVPKEEKQDDQEG